MKKRNITFKPKTLLFGPLTHQPKEMIQLSDDEMESLYLADFKGLYQEECARQLGVSRPTFAKLIKNARKKVTEMLMYGKGVEIIQEKRNYVMVYPTNDRVSIHPYFLTAKLFAFANIANDKIVSITYMDNPIYKELETQGKEIIDDTHCIRIRFRRSSLTTMEPSSSIVSTVIRAKSSGSINVLKS